MSICDDKCVIYLNALINICLNKQFKQEVIDMDILKIACICLSAWFINKQITKDTKISKDQGEIVNGLILIITYCFSIIHQIDGSEHFDDIVSASLQVVQEMDIFKIFQIMSQHNEQCVHFFSFNSSLRGFCETSVYRFNVVGQQQNDCLNLVDFCYYLLQNYPKDAIEYLAGCCIDTNTLQLCLQSEQLI